MAGALAASGLDPGELMLEITESVLAAGQQAMLERLAGLRALGVHLAIDDLGTGYSSLAYLAQAQELERLGCRFGHGFTSPAPSTSTPSRRCWWPSRAAAPPSCGPGPAPER